MERRKFLAPEFVFGTGAAELAPQYARNLGCRRILLVTDPGVIAAGWVLPLENALHEAGLDTAVFSAITANPKDAEVAAGAAAFAAFHADGIISIGGGSPMDCAKGIGILAAAGGSIGDYAGVDRIPRPMPPLICIPTTAGTSADVSQFAIISDTTRHVKMAIVSKAVIPDVALIDPAMTSTMEPGLTAATGVDALVHAFEAYVSLGSWSMTDLHAERAVSLVGRSLARCIATPGDMDARTEMMEASLQAGLAFSNASLGMVHAMAHSLGGLLDLPHGECNALLLPGVVAYNLPAAADRYLHLMTLLGLPVSRPADIPARLREFLSTLGIREKLGLSSQPAATIETLARNALADACMVTNPRFPDPAAAAEIYAGL